MSIKEFQDRSGIELTSISETQLKVATLWIELYIKDNIKRLQSTGVNPSELHAEYCNANQYPIGRKTFAPLLHLFGLEKVMVNKKLVYVMFNQGGK